MYKAATPFLQELTELVEAKYFHLNMMEELNKGNPNAVHLMCYRDGYEYARELFLKWIDPK